MKGKTEKKGVRLLELGQKRVCKGIINQDTRINYLFDYCFENHLENFIRWAKKHNSGRGKAIDVFLESVRAIDNNFKKGIILLESRAISSESTDFNRYIWKTLKNRFYTSIMKERRIRYVKLNENSNRVCDEADLDSGFDDNKLIEKYIYNNLNRNDKRRYRIYFIDRLTHEQVFEQGILGSVRSSITIKSRLVLKFRNEWEKIVANDKLLDYIRWKYSG